MNTGLLRAAVATAPTVYGIETQYHGQQSEYQQRLSCNSPYRLRY